jgi:predicted transcriptional regulator
MARPKIYEEARVTTALRLPESLHDRLRAIAEERDVSVNLIATKAIKEYLDHLRPVDAVTKTAAGHRGSRSQ